MIRPKIGAKPPKKIDINKLKNKNVQAFFSNEIDSKMEDLNFLDDTVE